MLCYPARVMPLADSATLAEKLPLVEEIALERRMVTRAIDGDHTAFRWIVDRHGRGLFALCVRMVGDRAEAEDLVQVAFARAARRIESFDPTYRLSTWLYRIALNACRDHLKSPRRRERPGDTDSGVLAHREALGDRPDERRERREEIARLHAALDTLRPAYREILILKDVEERSYEEIRQLLGSPITALKIRAIRARAKLAAALEEQPW